MRNTALHLPKNGGLSSPKSGPENTPKSTPVNFNTLLYGGANALGDGDEVTGNPLAHTSDGIPTASLLRLRDEWLGSSTRAQNSPRTVEQKRIYSDKLIWFVHDRGFERVGLAELEAFVDHLTFGHQEPGGRWGNSATDARATEPMRPVSVATYYAYLKGFWTYLEKRGHITSNPFRVMEPPKFDQDQIQPFTSEQIKALLRAAKASACPARNQAIVLFLLDTGARASELCGLKLGDVDFSVEETLRVRVLGKGNKHRTLRLSPTASQAMWAYFKSEHGLERYYKNRTSSRRRTVDGRTPLFISAHRAFAGQPLTRSGLKLLINDLGRSAGIGAVRCSPHTFRHTFALNFLRAGGNLFSLRDMLGHTSVHQVQVYLALAQSDLEAQHAQFSPVESILRGR